MLYYILSKVIKERYQNSYHTGPVMPCTDCFYVKSYYPEVFNTCHWCHSVLREKLLLEHGNFPMLNCEQACYRVCYDCLERFELRAIEAPSHIERPDGMTMYLSGGYFQLVKSGLKTKAAK